MLWIFAKSFSKAAKTSLKRAEMLLPLNGILSISINIICIPCHGWEGGGFSVNYTEACVIAGVYLLAGVYFLTPHPFIVVIISYWGGRSDMSRLVFPPGFTPANKKGTNVKFLSLHGGNFWVKQVWSNLFWTVCFREALWLSADNLSKHQKLHFILRHVKNIFKSKKDLTSFRRGLAQDVLNLRHVCVCSCSCWVPIPMSSMYKQNGDIFGKWGHFGWFSQRLTTF